MLSPTVPVTMNAIKPHAISAGIAHNNNVNKRKRAIYLRFCTRSLHCLGVNLFNLPPISTKTVTSVRKFLPEHEYDNSNRLDGKSKPRPPDNRRDSNAVDQDDRHHGSDHAVLSLMFVLVRSQSLG